MAVYYLYDLIISTLLMHVITLYNRFCSFATSSLFTLFGCLRTRPRPLKLHIHLGIEIIEPTHFKDSSRVNLLLWYIFLLSLRLLHCLYYTKYINFILIFYFLPVLWKCQGLRLLSLHLCWNVHFPLLLHSYTKMTLENQHS